MVKPTPIPATADVAQKRLAAIDLAGIDVRFLPIGSRDDNVGIVAFNEPMEGMRLFFIGLIIIAVVGLKVVTE